MSTETLDGLVEQALISAIAQQVVDRLTTQWRSAVVLFGGSDMGLDDALTSIDTLAQNGWTLDYTLSLGARARFGRGCDEIFMRHPDLQMAVEEARRARKRHVDEVLDGSSIILVPNMSVPLASKVALGLCGGFGSHLLRRALERGKTIVVAADGCCPNSRARHDHLNAAYRAMMGSHLESLRAYGMRITWAKALARVAEEMRPANFGFGTAAIASAVRSAVGAEAPAPAPVMVPAPMAAAPLVAPAPAMAPPGQPIEPRRRVFGAAEASAWQGQEARLGPDVLVTPLAADTLRSRGITLVRG